MTLSEPVTLALDQMLAGDSNEMRVLRAQKSFALGNPRAYMSIGEEAIAFDLPFGEGSPEDWTLGIVGSSG
jgi:hypothetical protein